MRTALPLAILLAGAGATARAQTVSIGVQGVLGNYRETSSNLQFHGPGVGGSVWLRYARFSAEGSVSHVYYDPRNGSSSLTKFQATQFDGRIAYDLWRGVAVEAGGLRRTVTPDLAAQEMNAARIGVRYSEAIGPGATVTLRGDYLARARFTGQGSANLAFELGLSFSAGSRDGRYRFTGDYTFQRIDRKVGGTPVPIQQSLVRLGVAVGF